jgi:hypothetical protein
MVLCIVKNMHHKPEKNSVETGQGFIPQTLAWRAGKRLRKIVCQDLLSQNDSVILLPVVHQDCLFRAKIYLLAESGDADVKA